MPMLQHQEQRPISHVIGRWSTGLRTLHDNISRRRAYAPFPGSAALVQEHFKDRQIIEHRAEDSIGFFANGIIKLRKLLRGYPIFATYSFDLVLALISKTLFET